MATAKESKPTDKLLMLPVDKIEPNPYQPRRKFDETKIAELAASIKKDGLNEPIVVRQVKEGEFQLLMGDRRLRAHKLLGLLEIKSILRKASDKEARRGALVENIQREDLTLIEEAEALKDLVADQGGDIKQTSAEIGKSELFINERLALLELPEAVQKFLDDGALNLSHAKVLLEVPNKVRYKAAEQAVRFGFSPDQLRGSLQQQSQSDGGKKGRHKSTGNGEQAMSYNRLSSLVINLYDGLESYDFSKLKTSDERKTLFKQLALLEEQIQQGLKQLEEKVS